jgi:hypothetical protein
MQNPWEKWDVIQSFGQKNVNEKDYVNLGDERMMNLKCNKGGRMSG